MQKILAIAGVALLLTTAFLAFSSDSKKEWNGKNKEIHDAWKSWLAEYQP